MLGAFTQQLHDARLTRGRLAEAVVWAEALVDLLPTAFREHQHVIAQDLRHAVRILATNPGFTIVAVLSLALGIGANTAIFSLVSRVLMSALPVRNPQEIVILTDPESRGVSIGSQGGERALLTYTEFRQLQDQDSTLSSMMASQSNLQRTQARIADGEAEEVAVRLVSASYFATLGVPAVIGQTFDARQEPPPGTAPYAVISHEFWQRRFRGRPDVLGRSIAFRGGVVSVIGVTPPSFFGETVGERPDVWVPLAMQAAVLPGRDWLRDQPGSVEKVMWLHVFGRLRPGVTLERAQADANTIFTAGSRRLLRLDRGRRVEEALSRSASGVEAGRHWRISLRGNFREPLFVLLGAAGLVLLIACANLGNLLLARTTARNREMSVRLALGASRGRLIRQLMTESLCLAAFGGLVGLFTAFVLRQGLLRLVSDTPIALPGGLDLRTVSFVVALTVAAGLILGLLPGLRITKTQAVTGLREQGRGVVGSTAWLRLGKLIVVGQLALSLPLLVGAGLLVRTLFNLQRVDLGYPKDNLLTARVDGQAAGYDPVRQAAAFEELLSRIRTVPGVRLATSSDNGLFGGSDNGDQIVVEGYAPKGPDDNGSRYNQIGPGYFSTLGVPVLLGREIAEQDLRRRTRGVRHQRDVCEEILRRPESHRVARDPNLRRGTPHVRSRGRCPRLPSEPASRERRASLLRAGLGAGGRHQRRDVHRSPAGRRNGAARGRSPHRSADGAEDGRPARGYGCRRD